MPVESVPYAAPRSGLARQIHNGLREGFLPPTGADALLSDGAPWRVVAQHVNDRAWWRAQSSHQATPLRQSWRVRSWDATLCLETDESSIWVDPGPANYELPDRLPDLVLVTHAHHDHTARLGQFYARWPRTPVAMSVETAGLLALHDADDETRECITRAVQMPLGSARQIGGIGVRLLPAGHLLGAAMLEVNVGGDRLLITGDFALRDVGGLPGADIPADTYGLLLMESAVAPWGDLPVADSAVTRQPLLEQVASAWQTTNRLVLASNSLGQVQEAYATLIMAKSAGAWPGMNVRIAGYAASVSDQYYKALAANSAVWKRRALGLVGREVVPNSLVLVGSNLAGGLGNQLCDESGKHIPTLMDMRIYTHASWSERMVLALGTACAQIGQYHGNAPDLRLFLPDCGRNVVEIGAEGEIWMNQ